MDKALQTMINNMPEKTGRSLEQWKQVLAEHSFEKHGQAVNYLKQEHGVTHGFANTIVSLSKQQESDPEDLVTTQYQGKETLKPIFEAIIKFVGSLGTEVKVVPKKATVSVVRKHQFALIKPATKTRIDLGLKLKGIEPQGKLEASGPFGAMCTHRIQLTEVEQFDCEVKDWLRKAYEASV